MNKELIMIAERIKSLRERSSMTQAELAKSLSLSRSAVNSWEMGLSVPTTQYIIELAKLFDVSTDTILGKKDSATVSVAGLNDSQITAVMSVIQCFREANKK